MPFAVTYSDARDAIYLCDAIPTGSFCDVREFCCVLSQSITRVQIQYTAFTAGFTELYCEAKKIAVPSHVDVTIKISAYMASTKSMVKKRKIGDTS